MDKSLLENFKKEVNQIREYIKHIQSNATTDILYNKINDLVERRNEIAHGSEAVDNILGLSELENYIQFLENYCQAIFEILSEEEIKHDCGCNFQKIGNIVDIYDSRKLVFEIENYKIKTGDIIIVKNAKGRFFEKPILEIFIDNISYSQITISEKTIISVKLDPPLRENQEFFIKKG
jgi:RiboL-PSP-HEPN